MARINNIAGTYAEDPLLQDIETGTSRWFAELGRDTETNLAAMLAEATGEDVSKFDAGWMEDWGEYLPPDYDPAKETDCESAFDLAGQEFGGQRRGYKGAMGSLFDEAGTGVTDLFKTWEGGGGVLTGRKKREKEGLFDLVGSRAAAHKETMLGAGRAYDRAAIKRSGDILGIYDEYSDEFAQMVGILGEEEAFAGFTGYGKNIPSDIPGLTEDQLYHPDGTTKNQFELDKMQTLMGVAGARTSAAGASLAQQQSNLITLQGQQTQLWGSAIGGTDWGSMNWGGYGSSSTLPTQTIQPIGTLDLPPPPPGLS